MIFLGNILFRYFSAQAPSFLIRFKTTLTFVFSRNDRLTCQLYPNEFTRVQIFSVEIVPVIFA